MFLFAPKKSTAVAFKYLDLGGIGGRGGVVRFFMLVHDIPFTEELIEPGEAWAKVKPQLIKSGENPAGKLPVVKTDDGATLTQHIAIMRKLAADRSISQGDFANDAIADEYQSFREAWVDAAFLGGDKGKFQRHVVEELAVFEGLYIKYATYSTFLSSSKPLWGDTAIASLIRDIILTGFLDENDLPALAPRLYTMYSAFIAIPAVAKWIESKK